MKANVAEAQKIVHRNSPTGSAQSLERLFLEVRGFPVQRTGAHDAAPSERHHGAGSATARANSPPAGTRQHVTTSQVVPAPR